MQRKLNRRLVSVVTRVVVASVVSYALVNLLGMAFVSMSYQPINEAIMSASLLSFPLYTLIIVWVFADPNLKRILLIQFWLIVSLVLVRYNQAV